MTICVFKAADESHLIEYWLTKYAVLQPTALIQARTVSTTNTGAMSERLIICPFIPVFFLP